MVRERKSERTNELDPDRCCAGNKELLFLSAKGKNAHNKKND
jgi:hypothetical protein